MKSIGISSLPPAARIVILVAACLVPFANKAFFIDDPLFLWTAEHIRVAPAGFYDLKGNWHGLEMPMTDAMCNPPLMGFFLAFASLLVGWGEVPLHLVMLAPAIAIALGTFRLGQTCSSRPFLGAALVVLTPGFLVCSSSLMCDIMMLAFWVWAIVFWERGLAERRYAHFVCAGVLAGLCGLAKYSGLSVVPLLAAYGWLRCRRPGSWLFALLIPIAMLGIYEWIAYRIYGVSLFENAAAYAREVRPTFIGDVPGRLLSSLVFAGGCALPALLLAPCLWSRRTLAAGAALFLALLIGPAVFGSLGLALTTTAFGPGALLENAALSLAGRWPLELQRAIFLLGGISIVALVISDFRKHLDAGSALLGLWVLGVLVFASLFNWTINGRSVLPMLPAVGLLLARRLEPAAGSERGPQPAVLACGLGLAALTVLAVAAADYRLANSGREAAGVIASKYPAPANNLSFQGHWGFQYYLEKKGRRPLDVWAATPAPGELIAVPANEMHELPAQATRLLEVLEFRPNSWLTTLDRIIGVGFHSDFWGPLPFGVGHVEPERYYIFKVLRPFVFSSGTALLDPPEWKQEDQELAQCQRALRANPQDADAHFQAAVLLARQSQVPEAIAHWLEVVRLRPNDVQAHAQLGALYQATEKNLVAKDHYYAPVH